MGRFGNLGILRRPGASDRKKAEEALESAGMGGLRHRRFQDLSGGQQQRVLIARALVSDPCVLILDEPTAGLDPIGATAFDTLIGNLSRSLGLTVFLVTHDLDTLHAICDRIAVLADRVFTAGDQAVRWDGRDAAGRAVPSGNYVALLESSGHRETAKLVLVR